MSHVIRQGPSKSSPVREHVAKIKKKKDRTRENLPWLVWVVFGSTLAASFIPADITVLGLRFSGLAWSISLLVSIIVIAQSSPRWRFPLYIWLPWIILLFAYLPDSLGHSLDPRVSPIQRTFQLLSPLILGVALSTYTIRISILVKFIGVFRVLLVVFWLLTIGLNVNTIIALSPTGLAPQVMTAMLGCLFFICFYQAFGYKADLVIYIIMAMIPVLAITRTVIAVTLFMPTMTLVPIAIIKRVQFMLASFLLGVSIFFLPQVQKKMFYSGSGTFSDVSLENKELATSGRLKMWESLIDYANESPWFGHGTGQGETFAYNLSSLAYPHNDWLLTYTDYGLVGVAVYLVCNILIMLDCWRKGYRAKKKIVKVFFWVGASSFIPFLLVMFTDNIMSYASYYGLLQYTIIGLAYGSLNARKPSRRPKPVIKSGLTDEGSSNVGILGGEVS
jgi:O-antigen ligase